MVTFSNYISSKEEMDIKNNDNFLSSAFKVSLLFIFMTQGSKYRHFDDGTYSTS